MYYELDVLQKKLQAIEELLSTTNPKERGFLSHLMMRKREIEDLLKDSPSSCSS